MATENERGTTKVLVVTPDSLGKRMAGPAIRAWEMARVLSTVSDVRLVSTVTADLESALFPVEHADEDALRAHVAWADVVVFQGNNIATPDCDGYPGDAVYINNAVIVSDLSIYQGHAPNGDEAAPVGGYSVYIAAGSPYGDPGDVVAGGFTYITQYGGGNTVVMGSDGSAFSTVYLDVYTGADGGGFVMATNVSVDWGSFYGLDFSIDGGGDGNVYVDAGGNSGFGASGDYSTVTL